MPPGRRGELCTRGYSVMLGYKERTLEAIDDAGWMHTGDLATLGAASGKVMTSVMREKTIEALGLEVQKTA